MPIYEYTCNKCKKDFEVLQTGSKEVKTHDSCGGQGKRKVSLSSFKLNGSGWVSSRPAKDAKKTRYIKT